MNKKVIRWITTAVVTVSLLSGCQGKAATEKSGADSSQSSTVDALPQESQTDSESSEAAESVSTAESTSVSGDSAEEKEYISVADDTDTLVVLQSADPRGLDPAFADDMESSRIISQIYEGLLTFNQESMELMPGLAKSWEISADKLTYTFHLRTGVKFQDGTDFNAEAVKYNVDRQTSKAVSGMTYADFVYGNVKECRVVDASTVEMELVTPVNSFLSDLAMNLSAPIVSPAACEANGGNLSNNPVGTGPYKFVSWDKGNQIILEANENYRAKAAETQKLVFQTVSDLTERVNMLTAGAADLTEGLDPSVLDQLDTGAVEILSQDGMNVNYMAYNTKKLTDPKLRKALSQAVDTEKLTESLYQTYATPATSVVPAVVSDYGKAVRQTSYDAKAAKKVLDENGVTFVHIITYTNAQPYNTATGQLLAEAVQSYFDKVGIFASIDAYDWKDYEQKLSEGDYDICFYGWIGDNGDAGNFLTQFAESDPTMNVARYENEEYNTLLASAASAGVRSESRELYQKAEQLLADADAVLPISHQQVLCGYNKNLTELLMNPAGDINYSRIIKKAPSILP